MSALLSDAGHRESEAVYGRRLFACLLATAAFGVGVSYGIVYLFHLMLLLYVCLRATQFARGTLLVRDGTWYHLPLLVVANWYVLSLIWAPRLDYAGKYLGYLFCGLSIVFAMAYEIKSRTELLAALRVLAIVLTIELVICLLEVTTPFRYPISPFSQYASLFGRRYTLESIDNPLSLAILAATPTGFEWNPNNLAAVLVIVLPFILIMLQGWRRWLGGMATLAVALATGSRAAFLAILLMGVVASVTRSLLRTALVLGAGVAIWFSGPMLIARLTETPGRVSDLAGAFSEALRFVTQNESGTSSSGVRQQLLRNGMSELTRSNGLGVGAGGSQAVQEMHGTVNGETSMHNFWFEVVVEAGVYVGGAFLLWYAGLLYRMARLAKLTRDSFVSRLSRACALALTGFALAAVSASSTVYLLPMWLLLGLCIGVINVSREERTESTKALV